jgi:RecA/RadA recombinase
MARRKASAESAEAEPVVPRSAKRDRLNALVATLKGRYPGHVQMGHEYTMPWAMRRLAFGIPDLDIATNGGAPAGGMTMLVGKPGEGKNFLLNLLIRGQQRIYGEECAIAVIGTELPYDKTQGHSCGVKVALSRDEIAQEDLRRKALRIPLITAAEREAFQTQVGTFVVVPPSTAEESFEIAVDLVGSGDFNIVALDSFGSILTDAEEEQGFDKDSRVGGPAGLNTKLMRKLTSAFGADDKGNPNLTCFVGINQVRDKLKAQAFEKQTHESGGWALKHARFLTVELQRMAWVTKGSDADKVRLGKVEKWEITKQKAGGYEGHTGQYSYMFEACDIDMGELLLRLGQEYDVIDKSGNSYSYSGIILGVGKDKAALSIVSCDLIDELTDAVMQAAGVALVP